MNDSTYNSSEQCPACAENGRDTSKDNLATYSDGHKYCFSCGYYLSANKYTNFTKPITPNIRSEVMLPEDITVEFPSFVMEWVGHYGLTKNDMYNHHVFWSPSQQRLLFPIYGEIELLAYQGRYFGSNLKPKWWTTGKILDILHVLGTDPERIFLVEDMVSAIKVSKVSRAMPLFGSWVGVKRFERLFKLLERGAECNLWLDPDMRATSIVQSRQGSSVGLNMKTIFSEKDPKELPLSEIKERI